MAVSLGLDFGSRVIKIYREGQGIVLKEPNVAAVDTLGNVVAVGTDAIMVHGRAPGTLTLRRPIEHMGIVDFNLTAELLDRFLEKAAPRYTKHVTVAIKYSLGGKSKEILSAALSDCRTGKVKFIDSAAAALIGCGIVNDHKDEYGGTLVCDIGAAITEVAYLRSGELLRADSTWKGGDYADLEILNYIRRSCGLAISPDSAREAKHCLTLSGDNEKVLTLSGTDTTTGMPKVRMVAADKLLLPAKSYIDGAVSLINRAISNLPTHGQNPSHAEQLVLVGGGAQMPGIGQYIADAVGFEIIMPPSVSDAVISGLSSSLI